MGNAVGVNIQIPDKHKETIHKARRVSRRLSANAKEQVLQGLKHVKLTDEQKAFVRRASLTARRASLVAKDHLIQGLKVASKSASEYYGVVDERILRKASLIIKQQVIQRERRLAHNIEVASKYFYVKSISTTTVAKTFSIDPRE
jgi:hypothetical protein